MTADNSGHHAFGHQLALHFAKKITLILMNMVHHGEIK